MCVLISWGFRVAFPPHWRRKSPPPLATSNAFSSRGGNLPEISTDGTYVQTYRIADGTRIFPPADRPHFHGGRRGHSILQRICPGTAGRATTGRGSSGRRAGSNGSGRGVFDPDMVRITSNENPMGPCKEGLEALYKVAPMGWRYSPQGENLEFNSLLASHRECSAGSRGRVSRLQHPAGEQRGRVHVAHPELGDGRSRLRQRRGPLDRREDHQGAAAHGLFARRGSHDQGRPECRRLLHLQSRTTPPARSRRGKTWSTFWRTSRKTPC